MGAGYYDPTDLERLSEIGSERGDLARLFFDWYGGALADGALSQRTKALVALAVSHAIQCPYCIDAYSHACLEAGADPEQMTEALHVAAAVRACATLAHGVQMRRHVESAWAPEIDAERPSMVARGAALATAAAQREKLQSIPLAAEFHERLAAHDLWPLKPTRVETLQLNLGRRCNQSCRHCHVDAGPERSEAMSRETMQACLQALKRTSIPIVDLTGGAPELHPDYRWLVGELRGLGRRVIARCNLTVLEAPAMADLPDYWARLGVELVCSLPHARRAATDLQRGRGVFERSLEALRRLNAAGFGDGRSGLRLTLVSNPIGSWLPPAQASLEREWKAGLERLEGVRFDALFCIANMPIGRCLEGLVESGGAAAYLQRLAAAFNPEAAARVMCRTMVSVGWDGALYDCDFNQMLELELDPKAPRHIGDFDLAAIERREIRVGRHCFGCAAGAGSSCGGATT